MVIFVLWWFEVKEKANVKDIQEIYKNGYGAIATLYTDGTVACSGGGDCGNVKHLLNNVKSIVSTNYGAFAALKGDGSVVCWGNRDYGGNAGEKQQNLMDVFHLVATERAFAVQRKDGKEIVWGDDKNFDVAITKLREIVTFFIFIPKKNKHVRIHGKKP